MFRVLIADVGYLMRDAMNMMVSKVDGFEVAYCVDDGKKAAEICSSEYIDIVFMDIVIPGSSGIDTIQRIRKSSPDTSIYIVSYYSSFDLLQKATDANVRGYVSKPVSFSALEETLNNYKETFSNAPKQVLKLSELVDNRDYKQAYIKIPEISYEIFSQSKSIKDRKKHYLKIGQKQLNQINIYRYNNMPRCEELFPFENDFVPNSKGFEFWLCDVMNYVFEQKAIQKNEFFQDIFAYINDNIEGKIGLNEIVENCSISQGYLSRMFRKQYNVSVMEYIHMRKLYIAKKLLVLTDLSIADIAFDLGYSESGYFSKVFKKYENMTVLQYRNKYK